MRGAAFIVPTVLLLVGGLVFGILWIVATAMKSSDVYEEAVARARSNVEVRARLGEPIEDGVIPDGSIRVLGDTGLAKLDVNLSGPKGQATMRVVAHKVDGEWRFRTLEVDDDGGSVDLLKTR